MYEDGSSQISKYEKLSDDFHQYNFGTKMRTMPMDKKAATELKGSPISVLSQLELAYTLGDGNLTDHLNQWGRIVEFVIEDCKNLNSADGESEENTWRWRKKIDDHLINLRRLRATSSILLFMLPAFVKYCSIDKFRDHLMWFNAEDSKNNKIDRWVTILKSRQSSKNDPKWTPPKFHEDTGLCIESGANKWYSKYHFHVVVNVIYIKSMYQQWERQWHIFDQMGYTVMDKTEKRYHKMLQWRNYLECLLDIAENIKDNRRKSLEAR